MNAAYRLSAGLFFAIHLLLIPSGGQAAVGGLQFDGNNDRVSFGAASAPDNLGVTNFTVECWFKRTGAGVTASTGTGGINGVPLVTKGRGEADGDNRDANWFLGFTSGGVLTADFEDLNSGLNHPITGNAAAASDVWQHAAVTYDVNSGTWVLYLNGQPDATNVVTGSAAVRTPRFDSIQHAALASALNSSGTASGYFAGVMDEVRVWNYARTAAEIAAAYNTQITNATGLIGRWSLDDGTGTTAANSVGAHVDGTLINGPVWTEGYFIIVSPPEVNLTSPTDSSTVVGDWLSLAAGASPTTGANITNVAFFANGGKIGEDADEPYTFDWCDLAPDDYALTAVVMDDVGGTATSAVVNVTVSAPAATGSLEFDGNNDYVSFGPAPELGLAQFTLECWFKRTGSGQSTTTGTGGITDAIPLVTKGRGQAEASNVDMNWFLGISAGGNVLAADFEEGAAGSSPGLNHPVFGQTALANDVWYHAAATYDGTNWTLFLNGSVETNSSVGQPPRSDSIQHAALASALTSAGTPAGYFQGQLDEVRIWDYARSGTEIADNFNLQITNNPSGLVARWALNEAAGTEARDALCGGVVGDLVNGPAWSADHFAANSPPAVGITSPAGGSLVTNSPVLVQADASDLSGSVTNVEFYADGAKFGEDPSEPYTFDWPVSQEGPHTLTAVATDNLGAQATSAVVNVTYVEGGAGGLYFDGADDYVTFGEALELGVTNFTVECWLKRTGPGQTMTTGSGGVTAYPLVSKGRGEVDQTDNRDMNWFLGLNESAQLVADFEDYDSSLNHPITGNAAVADNVWQHAAVTYNQPDGTWVLYLNGQPDATNLVVGADAVRTPRSDSIQHAALASALTSEGAPSGYFAGVLDEVRVWNYARTATDIADNYQAQIPTAAGLIGRWSLNDGSGPAATNTAGAVTGTLTNGPVWVAGYPFPTAPSITEDPVSADVACGDDVTFTVAATGAEPLFYQWYFEEVPLSGETNTSLALLGVTESDEGLYVATVENSGGSVTSAPALLTVTDTNVPVITLEPQGATNLVGTSAAFTVAAASCSPLSYQWLIDAGLLDGATNATLTLVDLQLDDAGDYLAVVSNDAGSTTSAVAMLTVLLPDAPVATTNPLILTNGNFSAEFTGSPDVPYTVLTTTNLLLPGSWETLTNITSDGSGIVIIQDETGPGPSQRFYHLAYP